MKHLLKKRIFRQFVKFGVVGFTSTIIDWGLFYLLNGYFLLYYLFAKIISSTFAILNSFFWNRRWTFRSTSEKKAKEFSKFLIIALVGISANTLIMYIAVDGFHWRKIFGLISATLIVTFWNFLANKFWTFKHSQS